jgi:hypothetical protein
MLFCVRHKHLIEETSEILETDLLLVGALSQVCAGLNANLRFVVSGFLFSCSEKPALFSVKRARNPFAALSELKPEKLLPFFPFPDHSRSSRR